MKGGTHCRVWVDGQSRRGVVLGSRHEVRNGAVVPVVEVEVTDGKASEHYRHAPVVEVPALDVLLEDDERQDEAAGIPPVARNRRCEQQDDEQQTQRPSPWHDPAGWHRSIDEQVRSESEQPEELERPKAAERQSAQAFGRGVGNSGCAQPELRKDVRTADIAAEAVGMSRDTDEQRDDEPWTHERIASTTAALMSEAVEVALLPSDDPRRVAFRVRKAALLAAIQRLDEQQEAGK